MEERGRSENNCINKNTIVGYLYKYADRLIVCCICCCDYVFVLFACVGLCSVACFVLICFWKLWAIWALCDTCGVPVGYIRSLKPPKH